VFAGLFGTLIGGFAASAWHRRNPAGYAWMLSLSVLLAVPASFAAFLSSNTHLSMTFLGISMFLLFLSTGPVNTLIIETVPMNLRASAMALSIFMIHLFGDMWSPGDRRTLRRYLEGFEQSRADFALCADCQFRPLVHFSAQNGVESPPGAGRDRLPILVCSQAGSPGGRSAVSLDAHAHGLPHTNRQPGKHRCSRRRSSWCVIIFLSSMLCC
jgi:hypothetical protein